MHQIFQKIAIIILCFSVSMVNKVNSQSIDNFQANEGCTGPTYDCGEVITLDVSNLTRIPGCVNIADDSWSISVEVGNLTLTPTVTQMGYNGGWGNDFVPTQIQFTIPCNNIRLGDCVTFYVNFSVDLWEEREPCIFNNSVQSQAYCVCNEGVNPPGNPCVTECVGVEYFDCGELITMDVSSLTQIPGCVNIADDSWTIAVQFGSQLIFPTVSSMGYNGGWDNDFVPLEIQFVVPCNLVQDSCCAPFRVVFSVDLWEEIEPCIFNNPVLSAGYCVCDPDLPVTDTCETVCEGVMDFECGTKITMDVSSLTQIPGCVNIADDSWSIFIQLGNQTIYPVVTQVGYNGGYANDFVPLEIQFTIPCQWVEDGCCLPFQVRFYVDLWEENEPCVFNNPVSSPSYCICDGAIETSNEGSEERAQPNAAVRNNLTVFPNPASQYLSIASTGAKSYRIFNQQGEIVLSGSNNFQQINVEGLSNGLYFIELVLKTGELQQGRFVKAN